jgi:hypothetical protein
MVRNIRIKETGRKLLCAFEVCPKIRCAFSEVEHSKLWCQKKWNSRKTCLQCYVKCPGVPMWNTCSVKLAVSCSQVIFMLSNGKFIWLTFYVSTCFMCLCLSKCWVVSCVMVYLSPHLLTSTLLCTLSLSLLRTYILGCNTTLSLTHSHSHSHTCARAHTHTPWWLPNHWKTRYREGHNDMLNMDYRNCRIRALSLVSF